MLVPVENLGERPTRVIDRPPQRYVRSTALSEFVDQISGAEVLILDEPTSALDLKNQVVVLDWIHRLSHTDVLSRCHLG